MAGIMPKAMAPDEAEPVDNPQEEGAESATVPDDAEEQPNVTPEEQKAYEDFVVKGFDLLYSGSTVKPEILKLLDDDPSDLKAALGVNLELDAPADGGGTIWDKIKPTIILAAAAAIVTLEVVKSYPKGSPPDGAVILSGGQQMLEDLAEIAQKAGIHDYSQEEMADAFRRGADIFRAAAEEEGLIDTSEAKQQWGQIVQADQQGQVDSVVPGISQLGNQQQEPQQAPQGGMQ